MTRHFEEDGLSFDYPDDWHCHREEMDNGWTVTLQSPGAAFATITLDRDLPDPQEMIEAAHAALKAEYPSLEAEAMIETIAGEMAIGHDMEFFSLDMATLCRTRSFHGLAGTVLILCQTTDADDEDYEPVLSRLLASMRCEEE